MAIAVRQMVIRSTVQASEPPRQDHKPAVDGERLREEILAECRQLVREALRDRQER